MAEAGSGGGLIDSVKDFRLGITTGSPDLSCEVGVWEVAPQESVEISPEGVSKASTKSAAFHVPTEFTCFVRDRDPE
jgi:hypothetical protein